MESMTSDAYNRLRTILDILRKECPWDRKQTIESLRYLTIEEVFELSESILNASRDGQGGNDEFCKELGDLFMHLIFYSKIAQDEGRFTEREVFDKICRKLVDRHPFIDWSRYPEIGLECGSTPGGAGETWEQIKMREGRRSVLEGVPASLPPLLQAVRMQEKAEGMGFATDGSIPETPFANEESFGAYLFHLVNMARKHGINADNALSRFNQQFKEEIQRRELSDTVSDNS